MCLGRRYRDQVKPRRSRHNQLYSKPFENAIGRQTTFNNIFLSQVYEENGYFEVYGYEENNKEMIVAVQVGGNEGSVSGCSHGKVQKSGKTVTVTSLKRRSAPGFDGLEVREGIEIKTDLQDFGGVSLTLPSDSGFILKAETKCMLVASVIGLFGTPWTGVLLGSFCP